ncbi:MAG: hypothetical protein NT080_05885 [Spirochaetes bacterium]|nr:hypothetical protein [Spirochaetota bacterium]
MREPRLEKQEIEYDDYFKMTELAYGGNQKARSLKQIRRLYTQEEWDSIELLRIITTGAKEIQDTDLPKNIKEFRVFEDKRGKPITIKLKDSSTLQKISLENLVIKNFELQGRFPNLEKLEIDYCTVDRFPNIPETAKIKEIQSDSSYGFFGVTKKNSSLEKLWFSTTGDKLDGIENFPNLSWLVVTRVEDTRYNTFEQPNLVDISAVGKLPKLDYLWIRGAPKLESMSPVCSSTSISNLRMEDVPDLKIESLGNMRRLKGLSLQGCNLADTRFLKGLDHKLEVLLLERNPIREIDGLADALLPAEEMKKRQPGPNDYPIYPYTIDVKDVVSITRIDHEYLKASGFVDMKILDQRIESGLARIVE